jgi:hypothetical protein
LQTVAAAPGGTSQTHPPIGEAPIHAGERSDDDTVTDAPADTPTVFDRLIAAGLSMERVERHLGAGRVELDGEVVTDPYRPAPRGTRLEPGLGDRVAGRTACYGSSA